MMRNWLLAPLSLLLAGSAQPGAVPLEILLGGWICGGGLAVESGPPRVLGGYGPGGFTVATRSAEAQAFFSNGMQLAHAFAHNAATAAFAEARRLDPDCAMCAWGHAWSLGPTINYPIDDAKAKEAAAVVVIAEKLAADAPERDRKLIAALKLRYEGSRAEGNKAFAEAMDALTRAWPADDAILTLAADARMIGIDWSAATPASLMTPCPELPPISAAPGACSRSPWYSAVSS